MTKAIKRVTGQAVSSDETSKSSSSHRLSTDERLSNYEGMDADYFMCPLYVNFAKNRYTKMSEGEGQLIAMIPIRTNDKSPSFWIQRGVCLLCYNERDED